MSLVPTLDFEHADPARVDRTCRETGFLLLTGHGFPQSLAEEAWRATRQFFDRPLAEKLEVAMPHPGYPYGYAPYQEEVLALSLDERTPPDLKETFSIGPEWTWDADAATPTQWPRNPRGFGSVLKRYFREMGALADRLMALFARALELPEDYFRPFIDRHGSALRVLNYPALDGPPEPGQLRAGAHSDYGSLTILLAEPGSSGLEILAPDGAFRPVPVAPGALVVNVGDLLARWSNDRWVSTLHRVVPEPGRRQSIAFFHVPNWDAEIACVPGEPPKYPPVIAGEHLMSKFRKTVTP